LVTSAPNGTALVINVRAMEHVTRLINVGVTKGTMERHVKHTIVTESCSMTLKLVPRMVPAWHQIPVTVIQDTTAVTANCTTV